MRYLLDTHTFIWWAEDPTKLSSVVFTACQDRSNTLLLSLASIWEMQIKLQTGKLVLKTPLRPILEQQQRNGIRFLRITISHILALDELPSHHRDPFDRILIAQARVEGLTLITQDPAIARYPVPTLW